MHAHDKCLKKLELNMIDATPPLLLLEVFMSPSKEHPLDSISKDCEQLW